MLRIKIATAFCLGALAQLAAAGVIYQNSFDSGTEGWTAFRNDASNTSLPVTWSAGTGSPAGSLRHDAPSDGFTSFYLAPTDLVTALHSAVGGGIHWELSTRKSADDVFFSSAADIQIRGTAGPAGLRLRLSLLTGAAPELPDFGSFDVDFTTAFDWQLFDGTDSRAATQDEIDGVLGGALNMIIRAEYWSGSSPDVTFLDNVMVRSVPEPEPLTLLLAAAASLLLVRQRTAAAPRRLAARKPG